MTCDSSSLWFGRDRMTSNHSKATFKHPWSANKLLIGASRVRRSSKASSTECRVRGLEFPVEISKDNQGILLPISNIPSNMVEDDDMVSETTWSWLRPAELTVARLSTPNVRCKLPGLTMIDSWIPGISGDDSRNAADVCAQLSRKAGWWPFNKKIVVLNEINVFCRIAYDG